MGPHEMEAAQDAVTLAKPKENINSADDAHHLRVDGFVVLKKVGQGGMGDVYLARQAAPDRLVALKLIRHEVASGAANKRFAREIDILGRLKDVGIAQIHSTGLAQRAGETVHYLAMEWVDGADWRAHVAQTTLELRQKIQLWQQLCAIVGRAHRRGVVHRDLKPGNVMFDANGQIKVLDFGIARMMDEDTERPATLTHAGEYLGTLAFSAPEQIDGELSLISPRTDVYALGVLGFQLLAGAMPLDAGDRSLMQMMHFYRSSPAPSLATRMPELDRDVIAMVDQCLEQDPDRRYDDGLALADDLQRWLDGFPVRARHAGAIDRAKKFVRRNALATSLVGIAATSLIAASVVSIQSAGRATREREVAEQAKQVAEAQTRRAEAVNLFMQTLIGNASPFVSGTSSISLKDALGKTDQAVADAGIEDADSLSAVYGAVAQAYENLGEFDLALTQAQQAVRASQSLHPSSQAEAALIEARILSRLGQYDAAVGKMEAALAVLEQDEKYQLPWASAQIDLNYARYYLGQREAAFSTLAKVYPKVQVIFKTHPAELTAFEEDYGELLSLGGQANAAEPLLNKAMAQAERLYPAGHPSRISAEMAMASLLRDLKRYDESAQLYARLLDQAKDTLGESHSHTQTIMGGLAAALGEAGRVEEALPIVRGLIESRGKLFPSDHLKVLSPQLTLSTLLRRAGDCAASRVILQRLQPLIGATHPYRNNLESGLAMDAAQRGNFDDALRRYSTLIEQAKKDQNDVGLTRYRIAHANTLVRAGRARAALPELEALYQAQSKALGVAHKEVQSLAYFYAQALKTSGEPERASALSFTAPAPSNCRN